MSRVSFDTILILLPVTEGGREMALRYSWDPRTHEFIPRLGVRKLNLLVTALGAKAISTL